jgi:thiol-disulfide isomerase/thioredoxin
MNRLIAGCCLLVALVACKPSGDASKAAKPAATPAPAAASQAAKPKSPAVARTQTPSLQVNTIDGAHYDLAAHRGKWVVVNFWATWCTPCLKEMPELSALDAMREHIEVIGLAYDDIEPAELKTFLKKHPVVYPIAIVDTYTPPADFDPPRGLPTTYLIAPDGKVARQFLGPVTAHDIEAAIAAAGGPKAG